MKHLKICIIIWILIVIYIVIYLIFNKIDLKNCLLFINIINMEALEAFKKFKNESGTYDIDEDSLKEILSQFIPKPKEKAKRPPSTYMMWLNDNRSSIKEKYFGDYDSVETWDEDTVKGYFSDKGLGEPKKLKKPNMCILVSVKAGQLWKELSDDEKSKYSKPKANAEPKAKDKAESKAESKETAEPKDESKVKAEPKAKAKAEPKKKVKKVVKKGGKK